MTEIDIFKVLDFLRDHAEQYAVAKANFGYLSEFRKTVKSKLMQEGAKSGLQAVNSQEVYAYSHPEYKTHLEAVRASEEEYEKLRWLMTSAQIKADVWRSLQANARIEARTV